MGIRSRRRPGRKPRDYVELRTFDGKRDIAVPIDTLDVVGLRPVLTAQQVHDLFTVLNAPSIKLESQWARRMKDFGARLTSGQLHQVGIVARELGRRLRTSSSATEKEMFRAAKSYLSAEVSPACGLSVEDTEGWIERAVLAEPMRHAACPACAAMAVLASAM